MTFMGRLHNYGEFECVVCRGGQVEEGSWERTELDGVSFECVEEFCYLGDMISVDGGAGSSSVARVRSF